MNIKANHEYQSKRQKVLSEFGYGIMWLFLAILLEVLYFFNEIQMFFYHFIAGLLALVALYKFYKGIKKHRRLNKETS